MDSTVSTGAAAMMAVRVLLVRGRAGWGSHSPPGGCRQGSDGAVLQDHDVPEERIFLLSLLMAEMGVHSVAYAFPRVRIITTAVDKRINEEFHIIPGIGEGGRGSGGGALVGHPAHLSPCLPQGTLGTGTSAPTHRLPAPTAKPWTAEPAGPGGAQCHHSPHPPSGIPGRVLRCWNLYLFVFILSSRPLGAAADHQGWGGISPCAPSPPRGTWGVGRGRFDIQTLLCIPASWR